MDQVVTVDMVEEVVDIEMIEGDTDRKYFYSIHTPCGLYPAGRKYY